MPKIVHKAYVISDLHLGGRFPKGDDRGFRMMDRPDALAKFISTLGERPPQDPTIELVINGDFLDFLAETETDGTWKAFRDEPGAAVSVFRTIAGRPEDGQVFDALAGFLDAGHRLTILLGNHDIELAWPEVRAEFERHLWASPKKTTRAFNLRWIHDGEALILGDALIEHGNRYDPANFVDHGRLRRVRELRSRRLYAREEHTYHPPMGSHLVAEIMNPLKEAYPFIDLLKPESEPLIGLLLTLDPSKRSHLGRLAALVPKLPLNLTGTPADPAFRQWISDGAADEGIARRTLADDGPAEDEDAALVALVADLLPPERAAEASAVLQQIREEGSGEGLESSDGGISRVPISSIGDMVQPGWNLLKLLAARRNGAIERRLSLFRQSVRALRGDQTFDDTVETGKRYGRAAEQLGEGGGGIDGGAAPPGFRFVVFGHTHHRKKIRLRNGTTYVNTGTWARLMKFPDELVSDDDAVVHQALAQFVASIQAGTYKTEFVPTYARIDLRDDDRVDAVELFTYDPVEGKVE